MIEKFVWFNGVKFTRDNETGYYLNSTIRKRLHRYIWEYHNGPIPKGSHIHHIDGDKSNNVIENLMLLGHGEHATLHGNERAEKAYNEMIRNLNENARPKASEWHGSREGKEWHKKHYENTKDKLHIKKIFECKECGLRFKAIDNGLTSFCSNKCKSKWRRKSGIDDEVRVCSYCGNNYKVNKYKKNKTCSRSCSNKLRAKEHKGEIN